MAASRRPSPRMTRTIRTGAAPIASRTNLAGAARHRVRQHAIDAQSGDEQRGAGKSPDQRRMEARPCEGGPNPVIERQHIVDRQCGIDRCHGSAQRRHNVG